MPRTYPDIAELNFSRRIFYIPTFFTLRASQSHHIVPLQQGWGGLAHSRYSYTASWATTSPPLVIGRGGGSWHVNNPDKNLGLSYDKFPFCTEDFFYSEFRINPGHDRVTGNISKRTDVGNDPGNLPPNRRLSPA